MEEMCVCIGDMCSWVNVSRETKAKQGETRAHRVIHVSTEMKFYTQFSFMRLFAIVCRYKDEKNKTKREATLKVGKKCLQIICNHEEDVNAQNTENKWMCALQWMCVCVKENPIGSGWKEIEYEIAWKNIIKMGFLSSVRRRK